MQLPRSLARDLDDALFLEADEVMGVRRVDVEVAGMEGGERFLVERVAEADLHFPAEDGGALGTWVPVRRHDRAGRYMQAHGEDAGRLRIAFQDGRLRPL